MTDKGCVRIAVLVHSPLPLGHIRVSRADVLALQLFPVSRQRGGDIETIRVHSGYANLIFWVCVRVGGSVGTSG